MGARLLHLSWHLLYRGPLWEEEEGKGGEWRGMEGRGWGGEGKGKKARKKGGAPFLEGGGKNVFFSQKLSHDPQEMTFLLLKN